MISFKGFFRWVGPSIYQLYIGLIYLASIVCIQVFCKATHLVVSKPIGSLIPPQRPPLSPARLHNLELLSCFCRLCLSTTAAETSALAARRGGVSSVAITATLPWLLLTLMILMTTMMLAMVTRMMLIIMLDGLAAISSIDVSL